MAKKKKINWAEGKWKEHIVNARKHLWEDDSVEMFAKWLSFAEGMTMIDVGCGLGYNGWTYAKYFLKGGRYFGVDISEELVQEAKEISKEWANEEDVSFQTGDVYNLPFTDNFADITICQTLMMHLEDPQKAIIEMKRVTKPGGLVICVEPDNLSSSLKIGYSSLPQMSIKEKILINSVSLYIYEGHKKLGYGDFAIGNKIPKLMKNIGLHEIDLRNNDIVYFLQPPYKSEIQKHRFDMMQEYLKRDEKTDFTIQKKKFLAGGGTEYMFRKYKKCVLNYREKIKPMLKDQVEKKEFYSCSGGSNFFIIKGRKK